MKELFLRTVRYNAWANDRFIDLLRRLDDATPDLEIASSFPSIRKTVLHIWGAEDVWLQRLQQVPKPVWKSAAFTGSNHDLCDNWQASSAAYIPFVAAAADDAFFRQVIRVVNTKGVHYDDEIGAILQHVANHATYHRGQLVTMLRQAGITEIPQTDLIAFTRGI